uniref:N-acetyltransferase domain-containing protein n=1 Tax=Chrysotila carterae TaxID=13221 RepID=A0A7S4C3U6_CHRCT
MADEGDYSATLLQPQLVSSAAKLLAQQWPTQSVETRAASLDSACRRAATALPCHLVLVQGKAPSFQRVVAHARVQQACENADGFSAAVTSVVVDPRYRRHGLGKRLLRFVEKYASELGYGYMYLWTHDRQDFYYACGYSECEKVTMLSPAMSKLGGEAVGRLEALFSRKAASTGALSAEAVARPDSTWMRKRLLERSAAVSMAHATLRTLAEEAVAEWANSATRPTCAAACRVHLSGSLASSSLEWERQIGPCCGIAALRMARSALRPSGALLVPTMDKHMQMLPHVAHSLAEVTVHGADDASVDASLLQEARTRGFTSDGELFDAHALAVLAGDVCGVHATVLHDEAGSGRAAWRLVPEWLEQGGLAVVAYDKDELKHSPAQRGGHGAHYALVIGYAAACEEQAPMTHGAAHVGGEGTVREYNSPSTQVEQAGPWVDVFGPLLVCVHGLSNRLMVCSLEEMRLSCAQLEQVKPGKDTWVVAPSGLRLRNRVMLLS